MIPGLYREHAGHDWTEVEVLSMRADGRFVLREFGRRWPGHWLASIDQVRFPDATIEVPLGKGPPRKPNAIRRLRGYERTLYEKLRAIMPSEEALKAAQEHTQ